jgi:hypothetical protein
MEQIRWFLFNSDTTAIVSLLLTIFNNAPPKPGAVSFSDFLAKPGRVDPRISAAAAAATPPVNFTKGRKAKS